MKKRIYLLVGALCIIMQLVSSCTNFLEVEEKGKTTIPSFLSDPDGLNAGLVGAYNKMYAYYDNEFTKYPRHLDRCRLGAGSGRGEDGRCGRGGVGAHAGCWRVLGARGAQALCESGLV